MDFFNFVSQISPFAATCFTVGILLLLVEMIHPGFGVPGITGIALLFLGVFLSARTWTEVLALTLIILGIIGLALSFVFNSAKNGYLSKRLILQQKSVKESGYVAVNDHSELLGKEGTSVTILRPSGKADFSGMIVDVVTEGDFIPEKTKLHVIKVEGGRVIVRALE
jgi:membrane-bound ClpP family serine protease